MTNRTDLEPGIIPIFRLFMGLMFFLMSLGIHDALGSQPPDIFNITMWAFCGLMLVLLVVPPVRHWLGDRWLPLLLWIASLFPILADTFTNATLIQHGVTDQTLLDPTRLYFWLLIPLLLVSAQYGWRPLVLFSVGTSVLPTLFALPFANILDLDAYFTTGWIRLLLYSIAGYIVMRITSAARAQRNELVRKNEQLAQYMTTLEQLAVARERNRLARELHDTLAHTLSAISIQLKALDILIDADVPKARKVLEEASEITHKGLQEARRSLQALRARPIDELGLGLALAELAQRAAKRAGLVLKMDIPSQIGGLTPDREQQIYRITEEALNNVVRHANARTLSVQWAQQTLTIADDGRGFAVDNSTENGHYGLVGMHERAQLIDAVLTIASAPGKGTQIRLEVSP